MIKLSEIKEGSAIGILIHNNKKRMRMGARLKKHVKENGMVSKGIHRL